MKIYEMARFDQIQIVRNKSRGKMKNQLLRFNYFVLLPNTIL